MAPVDVIDAAYDLDADRVTWLRRLASAVLPLLDGGRGAFAYYYDAAIPPERWLDDLAVIDGNPKLVEILRRYMAAGDELGPRLRAVPEPLASAAAMARRAGLGELDSHVAYRDLLRGFDARDFVAFRTFEPGGRGVVIAAAQAKERRLDRRTQRVWARVAAHVADARRLRAALESIGPARGRDGSPNLRLRLRLRAEVLRDGRERRRVLRDAPRTRTEVWSALVAGQWSLIDRFEHGGRSYVVVRRNTLGPRVPRALTRSEQAIIQLAVLGKSIKVIAYELGLGRSTVSTHLSSGMRKLGTRTRHDLVQLGAQLSD